MRPSSASTTFASATTCFIEAYQKCARAFGAVSRLHVLVDWSDSSQGSPAMLLQALADVHKVFERDPATLEPVSALTVQRCVPSVLGRAGLALPALQIWTPDLVRRFLCLEDRCALVDALFAGSTAGENERCFARIEGELEALSRKYSDLRFRLAGYPLAASRGVYETVRDLGGSFALTAVVITAVLLVVFRSARYGAVCLVPNVLPLIVIAALLLVLDKPVDAANAMVFTICLAIADDDTIHLMSCYRQQRAAGYRPGEACHHSLRIAGRAMVVSALVFIGGFGALAGSHLVGYRIFALLACSGFAASLIGDLLILPALLIWLDDRNPS